ncbi:hypothetical protein [Streptomyces griseorubiginosus]|nr:hypothetical protein [Streptomyces griseorubiginosus]
MPAVVLVGLPLRELACAVLFAGLLWPLDAMVVTVALTWQV